MLRWLLLVFLLTGSLLGETRQPWTQSKIQGSPEPPLPYVAERLWEHLTFEQALDIAYLPEAERMFLAERRGKIWSVPADLGASPDGKELCADLATFIPNFFSLYGITFHPRFAENREVFLFYVDANGTADGSHIARFRMRPGSWELEPESREVLISFGSGGHNGGHLKFGPDGMLYFLVGDLEVPSPPDPRNTGQDLSDLASSVIRIDVDQRDPGLAYRIPPDNPFLDVEGARPEIWAYGFRNPWKLCFHPERGDMWVGDVGWELWELIYQVKRGGNYGWSITEGPQPIKPNQSFGPSLISPPAVTHSHVEAASITGGYFYGGDRTPGLKDAYLYGDYVTGKAWALWHDGENVQAHEEIADTGLKIVSFGEAKDGEVVFLNWDPPQTLYRFVENPAEPGEAPFPRMLSETGLFQDTAEAVPNLGVYPFKIQAPMWQDGATADYWIGIPGDGTIGALYQERRDVPLLRFNKPEGTVLVKTLFLQGKRVETQLLHFEGFWNGYSYRWNAEGTDAELVAKEGEDHQIGDVPWHFSARAECMRCHSGNFNRMLAFVPGQINRDDQLERFHELGLIDQRFVRATEFQKIVDPYAESEPIDLRARSWLHANCSHCHRVSGGGSVAVQMDAQCPPELMDLIDVEPMKGGFGLDAPKLIAPGQPHNSVLYYRAATSGVGHMPMVGARTIDEPGVEALRQWIVSLDLNTSETPEAGLDSPSAALQAVGELSSGTLKGEKREAILKVAAESKDPLVEGLFRRFLDSER